MERAKSSGVPCSPQDYSHHVTHIRCVTGMTGTGEVLYPGDGDGTNGPQQNTVQSQNHSNTGFLAEITESKRKPL